MQLLGEIEPAFAAQIDVYRRKIRAQLFDTPDSSAIIDATPMIEIPPRSSQPRGHVNEHGVVIDDYAAQLACPRRHNSSFAYERCGAITASCKNLEIFAL